MFFKIHQSIMNCGIFTRPLSRSGSNTFPLDIILNRSIHQIWSNQLGRFGFTNNVQRYYIMRNLNHHTPNKMFEDNNYDKLVATTTLRKHLHVLKLYR